MSNAHRLVSLLSRIATERAARGRTSEVSRPRLVRRTTGTVNYDPDVSGSPAVFHQLSTDPVILPPTSARESIISPVSGGQGGVVRIFIERPTDVRCVAGVDYMDLAAQYPGYVDNVKTESLPIATQQLSPADVNLIDRLFGSRRAPGVANRN